MTYLAQKNIYLNFFFADKEQTGIFYTEKLYQKKKTKTIVT